MIKDKCVNFYLKNRVKQKAADHHDLPPSELRKERLKQLSLDNLQGPELHKVCDIEIKSFDKIKIKLRIYIPYKPKPKIKIPVILFFHGGGFVMGNLDTHDYPCRCICKFSQMIVIAVDYRLAPENKFPIPVNDAKHALNSIHSLDLDYLDVNNIIVCGDSAGGNLAAVLGINSSIGLLPKIKGQILIYPWVDLTLSKRSINFDLLGATLTGKTLKYFSNHYLRTKLDETNYEASPLFSPNFENQPNTHIFAAELDPLLDEGIAYKNRLIDHGNEVEYKLYKDQLHGFVTNSKHFPKGLDCLKEISVAAKIMADVY